MEIHSRHEDHQSIVYLKEIGLAPWALHHIGQTIFASVDVLTLFSKPGIMRNGSRWHLSIDTAASGRQWSRLEMFSKSVEKTRGGGPAKTQILNQHVAGRKEPMTKFGRT